MRVFVTGTRGIPSIPGGVETHCENLYPRIVEHGVKVRLARRSSYTSSTISNWKGVELVDLPSPKKKSFEAILHTFHSVLEAKRWGADILHVHAVGPALLVPLARLFGLKVVFTHHGPDYDRDKWGKVAKLALKLGEKLGSTFSNEVIVISNVIGNIVKEKCKRGVNLIYNGVTIPDKTEDTAYLSSLGLDSSGYILAVARFVPEKGLHDLVKAYRDGNFEHKLVIAGDSDHDDEYSHAFKQSVQNDANIHLTGFVTGEKLHQLWSHASLFVLPSYHEGLPISLLEAMSYDVTPVVSDIPANIEVSLDKSRYFRVKDVESLRKKIAESLNYPTETGSNLVDFVKKKYDWEDIALQTIDVYKKVKDL